MLIKKTVTAALVICLLCAVLSPGACAATPSGGDFIDRCGPLLGDGLDALTDWLGDRTAHLAPELRETLRDLDTDGLLSDLRELAGETKGLDDDALRVKILELAEKHGTHLVDDQVQQLMDLCRALEKLDADAWKERADALRQELGAPGGLRGVWQSVVNAFKSAGSWLSEKLGGLLR